MTAPENNLIESKAQGFLSRKLSRREAIRVLTGAAISLETFLAACSKKTVVPFCEGAAVNPIGPLGIDCTRFPAIEIGKPIEESLNQTI